MTKPKPSSKPPVTRKPPPAPKATRFDQVVKAWTTKGSLQLLLERDDVGVFLDPSLGRTTALFDGSKEVATLLRVLADELDPR